MLESELAMFTGTERWYRYSNLFRNHLLTDGTKYLADHAGAYWLMDAIASHHSKVMAKARIDERLRYFQLWVLVKNKDNSATLCCYADDGEKPVVRQKIEYTDFPLNSIRIYVQPLDEKSWCIFLPSEY